MNFTNFAIATFLLGAIASLPIQAAVSCHLINAKAVGQDQGNNTTTGKVMGGGLIQGTIAGSITPTGLTGNVASFMETVTFTNTRGTLTISVTGGIDITTGRFNASGTVTSSTAKLSGATGNMALSGFVDFTTGAFFEDINGLVCVDLAP